MATTVIPLNQINAVIFDAEGVVTDTSRVHAAAWKAVFDPVLRARAVDEGTPFRPFDVRADYLRHVDGKPRLEGIRRFLEARGITLPEGEAGDAPESETVHGLGNRKDLIFLDEVLRYCVAPFPDAVVLLRDLRRRKCRTAATSASRHSSEVLNRAGLASMFDVRVDGTDAARLGFPGKPDPRLLIEAARRLDTPPERAAVAEATPAGVEAGRRGGFALVIGVDRDGMESRALYEHGADVVVPDLSEVTVTRAPAEQPHAT